jgi:ABC-type tungstate transport system permease subunit
MKNFFYVMGNADMPAQIRETKKKRNDKKSEESAVGGAVCYSPCCLLGR